MTNKYPSFISRTHAISFIQETDPAFAKQLTDKTQSFTFDGAYFAPAMNNYLVRIPFTYKPFPAEFGKQIFTDFNKMKKDEMVQIKKA